MSSRTNRQERDRERYDEEATLNVGPHRPDGRGSFSGRVDAVHKCLAQIAEALNVHEDRIGLVLRTDPGAEPKEDPDPTQPKRASSPAVEAIEDVLVHAQGIYESVIALTARVDI